MEENQENATHKNSAQNEQQKLDQYDTVPEDAEKSTQYILKGYVIEKGELLIGDHKVRFPRKRGRKFDYLPVLTADASQWENIRSWDEIHQAVERQTPPKNPNLIKKAKRKLFDAYGHINQEVLRQSNGEIKEFLIFSMNECHINPIYL